MTVDEALSGFSNGATITFMAMFVLSKGIQNSGALTILQNKIKNITGDNLQKQVLLCLEEQ